MTGRQRTLVCLAGAIATIGALIHVVVIVVGPPWYAFFGAPPAIVASARDGTWLAPVSTMVIAMLMGICAAYAFSAAGLTRRLPLLRLALGTIATICLVRALILIPFAIGYPQLRNTFEVCAAIVWGVAGVGFAAGWWARRPLPAFPA